MPSNKQQASAKRTPASSASLPTYVEETAPEYQPRATGSQSSPVYTLQSNFNIGYKVLNKQLVTPAQLQVHLDLLRAFKGLRTRVEQDVNSLPIPAQHLDSKKRWVWFLELSVSRFQLWIESLSFNTKEEFITTNLPPLDVWLVWHSYMLNPICYAEDCQRVPSLRRLKRLYSFEDVALDALTRMGDLAAFEPSEAQNSRWVEATGLPFDPIYSAHTNPGQEIVCPKCCNDLKAPFLGVSAETGYAEQDFQLECPKCQFLITKDNLAIAKFATDLVRDPSDEDAAKMYGGAVYLPGTLASKSNVEHRARKIKDAVLSSPILATKQSSDDKGNKHVPDQKTRSDIWEREVKEAVEYSMTNLRSALSQQLRPPMLRKILGCYSDGRPFSIELVGAVLRQGTFIDKMHGLGWLNPGFFASPEDRIVLDHCITRYHAFLDLMTSSPSQFFVPTLDIDLAWHTHQMTGGRYASECKKYLGRYINHDDKVEEGHLATSFDVTCRAWQARFGVRYMYCGCPLPGDTIGQKLSRLMTSNSILKIPINPPARDDCLLATHPSDHNSAYVKTMPHWARTLRAEKRERRRARDLEKVKRGNMDEAEFQRGALHDEPFLVPVPYHYYPVGFGYQGGCAAGFGGCGSGNAGCGAAGCGSGGCGGGCGGGGCGG